MERVAEAVHAATAGAEFEIRRLWHFGVALGDSIISSKHALALSTCMITMLRKSWTQSRMFKIWLISLLILFT